jgi:hypothetical protein
MKPHLGPQSMRRALQGAGWGLFGLTAACMAACNGPPIALWSPAPAGPPVVPIPTASQQPRPENSPALPRPTELEVQAPVKRVRLDVVLTILHVAVPPRSRAQTEPLWNHLREDVFDGATTVRLQKNGVRVGVGNAEWWDAVKATLDATDGVHSQALDPVRIPPDFPLALELDERPREQTLFFLGDDGILTGETWPQSRNVLRVSYDINPANPERVRVAVTPEVRQRLDGSRWVRSGAGLTQIPQYSGRAFGAAGFNVDLEPGEFLLVAPGPQADLYGIVGGAFLSSEREGERCDSYVFLRADMNHVAFRN